uniref:Ribosomal protein S4 n=1 Tax=Phaeophyceae sp. TaxID=2249243 RepID=A0A8E5F7D8_9PHAE|nr:ribosomal protein S4 [Phaeophyceae sp.]
MVRYRGPRLKIIRKFNTILPGLTTKKELEVKEKKIKESVYRIRLNEKQKLRYNYGITEVQLLRYIKKARRKKGLTGFLLMQFLEMRLDNIIFRLGLTLTIPAARQLVNHGHVLINEKKVNIPSFQCQPNDRISFIKNKKTIKLIESNIQNLEAIDPSLNNHLEFNYRLLVGKIVNLIPQENITFKINDMLVIEYYSKLK